MSSLLMRAHKLSFLSYNQYAYLWKQISARGYRLREPPELDFDHECPEVVGQIVRLHLEGLGYSRQELASSLCVRESELESLYGIGGDGGPRRARITVLK